MKKINFLLILLFFVSVNSFAQENTSQVYVQFDFHKVESKNVGEYLKAEQAWKKVHESAMKNGKALRWMQYEVLLPSGTGVEHNYVTVKLYKDYAALETIVSDLATEFAKVYPDKNFVEFYLNTDKYRERISTEIYKNVDGYWKPNSNFAHKYVRVDFMKTNWEHDEAYSQMEKTFWKPFHIKSVEKRLLNGWQWNSKIFRSPSDPHNQITISLYDNFMQTAQPEWSKTLRETHQGMNEAEFQKKVSETEKLREYKKVELWKLIDMI